MNKPHPRGAATVSTGRRLPLLLLLGVMACQLLRPAPLPAATGDSLIVQTFTFDDIAERRATFAFPTVGRRWEKVQMFYTLKCDEATPGDPYPCGEWDVTTYTHVRLHTGRMDSTLLTHPSFIVEGESPAEYLYSRTPRQHYYSYWRLPAWSGGEPAAAGPDHYLLLEGNDYISVPAAAAATLDSALTISCWIKGDSELQPQNDQLLEMGEQGGRIVNLHLPWGTGVVYFDAGGKLSGNNNRLTKTASPGDYKGRWNHWAFTKDVASGMMRIYLNGELWHSAGTLTKTMPPIDQIVIGANCNANGGYYAGGIDQFRLWDVALDQETIREWMHRPLTPEHPEYGHLRLSYDFEEEPAGKVHEGSQVREDSQVRDGSPHRQHGVTFGQPQRVPFGLRGRSDLKPTLGAVLQVDSVLAPLATVRFFDDPERPDSLTRMEDLWPACDSWFDGDGRLLFTEVAEDCDTLIQQTHSWYGPPFEVVERYELARFITPYGKGLNLGEDGFTWIYDVTDYAHLLAGEVDLQAANDFELLDLRFLFIEGIPPHDLLALESLWPGGNYRYADLADDKELTPLQLQLDPEAGYYLVRSRISGHGHFGPENCCEWSPKRHLLYLNGWQRFEWEVWKNCGFNPVFPQGGTWQFDRAGWCPGTFVDTYDHDLTPFVQPGEAIILDYGIEPYDPEWGEEDGRYVIEQQLLTYGPPNFQLDAAVIDILAPSDHDEHNRLNPVSGDALVRIRNNGAEPLTSLEIRYGLEESESQLYSWEGELRFLETETVTLPAPDWSGASEGARFTVEVGRPNGEDDQYRWNDRMISRLAAPLLLPREFLVQVESPGFGRAADNSWTIIDRQGRVVAERREFHDDSTHSDLIRLEPGAYEFTFVDGEEDGLIRHWWLRGSDPERIGENGRVQLVSLEDSLLLDLGYDFAEGTGVEFFIGKIE